MEAIEAAVRTRETVARAATNRRRDHALIGPAVKQSGPAAALCTAIYVQEHGTGPTWGELAAQFGWPRSVRNVIIQELAKKGWLSFTKERRSLRPGPAYAGVSAVQGQAATYIVIKQWITSLDGPTEFTWSGAEHSTHEQAIDAGFSTYKCDDFNIGRVESGQLVWFGWMHDQLPDYDLTNIAHQVGLVTR
jgi:hypothetical protein